MKRQSQFFLLLLIIVLLMATGCGLRATQRTAVDDFAESTAAVGKIASDELVSMRNESITMNRNALELAGPDPDLPKLDELDGAFRPAETIVIFKAIGVIRTYGESLQTLVRDTQQDNLKKASDNLVKSIDGLPEKYVKLSAEEQGAIGQVVTGVGGMVVEEMKEKYVKQIVRGFKEPVNRLAQVLADDFDEKKDGSIASVFLAYSVRAAAVANRAFDNCKDVYCREKALKGFENAQANVDRSETVFSSIKGALARLTKANNEMAEAMESNKISEKDIREFGANVKNLADAVKVLSK